MIAAILSAQPLRGTNHVLPGVRQILHGRVIDKQLLRTLKEEPFDACVHSVFDRVINIEFATGGLFTLAGRELDNAPDTAIVDIASFCAMGIAVGDAVANVDGELHIGQTAVVQWTGVSVWEPSLPVYASAGNSLRAQLRCARSYLLRHDVRGGMAGRCADQGAFAVATSIALKQRSSLLLEALAQARHADASRHAVSMIGLGPGLTPSGDDFLVGLLAVLNLADSPCEGWLDHGAQLVLHAQHSTNAISLAALTTAANGRVRESVAALIDSLLYGAPASLAPSLRVVLAIGDTSGADIVAGILAGLELNLHVEAARSSSSTRSPISKHRFGESQASGLGASSANYSTGA